MQSWTSVDADLAESSTNRADEISEHMLKLWPRTPSELSLSEHILIASISDWNMVATGPADPVRDLH